MDVAVPCHGSGSMSEEDVRFDFVRFTVTELSLRPGLRTLAAAASVCAWRGTEGLDQPPCGLELHGLADGSDAAADVAREQRVGGGEQGRVDALRAPRDDPVLKGKHIGRKAVQVTRGQGTPHRALVDCPAAPHVDEVPLRPDACGAGEARKR